MNQKKSIIRYLCILSTCVSSAIASDFTESFNGGDFDTNLIVTASSGFNLSPLDGRADFSKQAGIGNGSIFLGTHFDVIGDFTATVQSGRTSLGPNTELGLWVETPNGQADIFFYGGSRVHGNIFIRPGFGTAGVDTSASILRFRISRVGNSLSLQYDAGGGFQTLRSANDPALAGPMKVKLFLVNEFGDTAPRAGWFDNLTITADQLSPTPIPRLVSSIDVAAVRVKWPSVSNRTYQVEYRSALTTNIWAPLGAPTNGTGSAMAIIDPVLDTPQRFYRVIEVP